ncbi:PepSY domain-containing protein [Pseudomonas sp. SLFW]|uniref:PepSY-associated TM helix domain-containing protein n=1 Tax=Pseudomonas sp. SLFW TaxID=2683259 RepID=UPI00141261D7|nr:PepSY domain-containing protein [Pseudomonas sp. SLFW]NBB09874.1 PepSY domain-containing protein [Pseudomonas sp. SLFW]
MPDKSRSRRWFLIHSWMALPIWFFVLFVCVTGTLAVVSEEIVWLTHPEARATKPSDAAVLMSYDQMIEKMKQASPGLIVQSIRPHNETHFATTMQVSYSDGRLAEVYVNPYTGLIQGESAAFNFKKFTRALHGWLLVPFSNGYSWGWYVVSFLGVLLTGSVVTGVVVYKRFWRGFFKAPRLAHGARVFWGDFHRLAGLWSMGFVALIAVTATWFLVQAVLSDHHIEFPDPPASQLMTDNDIPKTPAGSYPQPLNPDQAIHLVSKRIPGFQPGYINLPRHAYDYLDIGGQGKVPFIYQSVSMNPYTGAIAISRLMRDRPTLEVLVKMMRPLHTGDFGGLWIKLIWCFFGILLSLMVLSGLLIWSKRTVKATASLLNRSARRRRSIAPPVLDETR